jgi:hypothetical protein
MPPRAGTIPVDVELAGQAPAVAAAETAAAEAPAPVAEAPASAPPSETATQPAAAPATLTSPAVASDAPSVVAPEPPAARQSPPPATPPAAAVPAAIAAPSPPSPAPSPQPAAPETPQGRPAWVDGAPKLAGSVYSLSVSSGRFVTVPECQRELDLQIKHEADHYIDEYIGERASTIVNLPISYLKEHVKKAEYAEVVQSESVGPMHQIHALLEFDDQARSDFRRQWHNAVVTDRLWYTGSGAALVLALLATFYGYLKLDLRTGPAQKGRLQLAATLVALIVAAGALLFRWAVPF